MLARAVAEYLHFTKRARLDMAWQRVAAWADMGLRINGESAP